jgi:hypothetical protein
VEGGKNSLIEFRQEPRCVGMLDGDAVELGDRRAMRRAIEPPKAPIFGAIPFV